MMPTLITIDGPLKGTRFVLTTPETPIGRVSTNPVALHDLAVSRRHCVIQEKDGGHVIVDLDSHNGTFVNGLPVKEQILEDGDRINIGGSCFLFRIEPDRNSISGSVLIQDGSVLASSSMMTMILPGAAIPRETAALLK